MQLRRRKRDAGIALCAAAIASLLGLTGQAAAEPIIGEAVVVKPYAFMIDDYTVYLLGVDSVEVGQRCSVGRDDWDCWAAAQRQLETIVSEGELTCDPVVGPNASLHVIATCTMYGEDIAERFVSSGFAVTIPAETDAYDDLQATAREAGIGLWQGQFTPPAIWRSRPMRPPSERPRFVSSDR